MKPKGPGEMLTRVAHGGHGEAGTNLYDVMAQAARGLQGRVDVQATMQEAIEVAVRDLDGADAAALSIVHRHGLVVTPVATHGSARHADELQYDAGEGPCLSAVWEQRMVQVPSIAEDLRWPAWSAAMTQRSGYRSMLVFRLFTAEDRIGALNLYSSRLDGFDQDDVDQGGALAAHIAVAISSARDIEGLNIALDGRTVVGQAQGLLMERFDLDQRGAFAVLTRLSSHSNRKLREVAHEIVTTRVVPGLSQGEVPDEARRDSD